MSIQVISTTESPEVAKAAEPEVKVEETKSAPESKETPEQNESSESDAEENEAEESKDESEGKESDEDSESKDLEKEKPKSKNGWKRRLDKEIARKNAAQQEVEYWKSQALKSAGEPKKEPVETKTTPAAADNKPNADNFDTHAEYVEALTDWKVEQKQVELDQKREKSRLQVEQENLLKSHSERFNSFAEKNEDFEEMMANLDDVPNSPTVESIIVSSENGPEILYELAKNPVEALRISKLPPLAAARELGKIEARIALGASSEKKPEPKKITNAPKPLEPVGKGGSVSVAKSIFDPDISQSEYERRRREQQMRKKQA